MTCKYLQPKQNLYGFELPCGDMLRCTQLAEVFDCTLQHVINLCDAFALESINITPEKKRVNRRILRSSVISFIEERTTGPIAEVDFSATKPLLDLPLPEGRFLTCNQVAEFLHCSQMHIINLVGNWDLVATNITMDPTGGGAAYRIPRAGLIHFINSRMEGAF